MEKLFKYHGLGNDFVILDRRGTGVDIDARAAIALCDRRRGVGGDGVLVLLPSTRAFARMVVHNPDGSVAEMCGNGLRCAVKYLVDRDGERRADVAVETGAGVLHAKVSYADGEAQEIELDMGPARLVAPNLPSAESGAPWVAQPLPEFPGLRGTAVSMGNPHLVLDGASLADAERIGPLLERSPLFPERTNVEFVRADEDGGLTVVVWERGAGLTQACGTGACAATAAAVHHQRMSPGVWIPVRLPGGALQIRVAADLSRVDLRGPATFVFEGVVPAAKESLQC